MKLSRLDELGGLLAESTARKLSRRSFFQKTLVGASVTAAGIAVGQMFDSGSAFAQITCGCGPPRGVFCSGCTGSGCPSGYKTCTTASGCTGCIYSGGSWIGCSGYGPCGNGYNLCIDCVPTNGACSATCGCGTNCICCNCCKASEVQAEQKRILAALETSAAGVP